MGNGNWGAGFATGIGAGANVAENNMQPLIRSLRNEIDSQLNARRLTEQNFVVYFAAREGARVQRNALLKALSDIAPNHPLVSPVNVNGDPGSPLLSKIYDEAYEAMKFTGFATNQELRAMCPLLAAEFDENQKKLAEERKKQEEARMKALEKEYLSEMKASGGGGMFARLLGSRPTGFPEFKDWLVQKGYVKPAGQDQANGVEQKG